MAILSQCIIVDVMKVIIWIMINLISGSCHRPIPAIQVGEIPAIAGREFPQIKVGAEESGGDQTGFHGISNEVAIRIGVEFSLQIRDVFSIVFGDR